jgi:cysteine desulfurase/selenocysteine lyase
MQESQRDLNYEFPIKKNTAYFNNASYTPLSTSASNAISEAFRGYARIGPSDDYYKTLKDSANSARSKLASIINSQSDEIVFTESATQSINFVANGLKLNKGESIITRGGSSEHPSNYLPWKYYSDARGVQILDLDINQFGLPDLSQLDSLLKKSNARLVVMSHVIYNLGTIMPAREASKIAHERGALFFLDASQSVGSIPVDVKEIGCDFLAGTAAKWLCGPLGVGFFYCKSESVEHLEPLNFGPNSCTYTPDGKYDPMNSTQRLQEGFRNWASVNGFEAALDLWNNFGPGHIRDSNLKLARMIIEGITSGSSRFSYIGIPEESLKTSIIPLDTKDLTTSDLVKRLQEIGIVIAEREVREKKILRISPHFYNDTDEADRLVEALFKN